MTDRLTLTRALEGSGMQSQAAERIAPRDLRREEVANGEQATLPVAWLLSIYKLTNLNNT